MLDGYGLPSNYHNIISLNEILKALNNNQFKLLYQPIIDLQTVEVTNMEALVRWDHPIKGLIAPGEFFAQLEAASLLFSVQEWVIESVIKDIEKMDKICSNLTYSINLTASDGEYDRFLEPITIFVEKYDLDPGRIIFEVSEKSIMNRNSKTFSILEDLRDLGFQLAIDDFGSGYASSDCLNTLKVDYIKLDQKYVKDINNNLLNQTIISATLAIARKLGIKVVAEGVEREEEYLWLKTEGCNFGQGFHFAHPMPLDKLCEFQEMFIQQQNRQ